MASAQTRRELLLAKAAEGKKAKTLEEFIVTDDVLDRYLQYKCNFGKHKGETWKTVITADIDYARWALINFVKVESKTWKVLAATILNDEERVRACNRVPSVDM